MFVPINPLCLGGFLIPHDLIYCIDEKEGVTDDSKLYPGDRKSVV